MAVRLLLAALVAAGTATPAPATLPTIGDRALARAQAASPDAAPSAAPSAEPASAPSPDAKRIALARGEFEAWQRGAVDTTRYAASIRDKLTPDAIAATSEQYLKRLGALKRFVWQRSVMHEGTPIDVYLAECEKGSMLQIIAWDGTGKINTIVFRFPQAPG